MLAMQIGDFDGTFKRLTSNCLSHLKTICQQVSLLSQTKDLTKHL